MKILLIGHSIIDHIDEKIKPGGIFYSLTGMTAVKREGDDIYLLTGINNQNKKLFQNYCEANLDFSFQLNDMPEVFLRNFDDREREEVYKNISVELPLDKINNWHFFDGILINMITGFDISIDNIEKIRNAYKGLIYFDVHTLARGVDSNMQRNFRPIPQIEKWLVNIDILQCNENELTTIVDYQIDLAAEYILNTGVKILIVTKGENGVAAFYKEGNIVKQIFLEAEKIIAKNKIGCGDIFGAVFFYSYLRGGNLEESLKKANKAAAITAANSAEEISLSIKNGLIIN